jgi:hypothetical protein
VRPRGDWSGPAFPLRISHSYSRCRRSLFRFGGKSSGNWAGDIFKDYVPGCRPGQRTGKRWLTPDAIHSPKRQRSGVTSRGVALHYSRWNRERWIQAIYHNATRLERAASQPRDRGIPRVHRATHVRAPLRSRAPRGAPMTAASPFGAFTYLHLRMNGSSSGAWHPGPVLHRRRLDEPQPRDHDARPRHLESPASARNARDARFVRACGSFSGFRGQEPQRAFRQLITGVIHSSARTRRRPSTTVCALRPKVQRVFDAGGAAEIWPPWIPSR